MAQNIKLKRSAVADKVPLTTDLALGELAINTNDGKIYYKKDNGTESIVQLAIDADVVKLTGNQTIAGVKTFSDTTASTNTTTGALTVAGGVGIGGAVNVSGGMTVTPNATAPTSNVTIGPSAGATLGSGAVHNVLIGEGAGDLLVGGQNNVAIGTNALGSQNDGASSISNTTPGSGGTPSATITGVTLEKHSGTGTFAVYPTVTLVTNASGAVTSISLTNPGSGATTPTGIILQATAAGIALGAPANWRGTTGANIQNTAIGHTALSLNTSGSLNVAVGGSALRDNTTGNLNTAVGFGAGALGTTGQYNVSMGRSTLVANTTGSNNTALGTQACSTVTTGSNNTVVGMEAARRTNTGSALTSIDNSVFIGQDARALDNAQTNQIVIAGVGGLGNGSNTTTLGNSDTLGTYLPNGTLYVQETDNSTSPTTGALVVSGGVGVGGAVNVSGGMTVTPNATAPTSNVTIGPSAGATLGSGATNNVLIGEGAGDTITGSNGSVAIGLNALGAQVDGATSITNTTPGTGGTGAPTTYNNILLEKDSGVGEMAVYPTVNLRVSTGGAVDLVTITSPGSGATVASGIVLRAVTTPAGVPTNWRGTLASVPVNTALGQSALQNNTTGTGNFALGQNALQNNTTGNNNSAVGQNALQNNTTGLQSSAVGNAALRNNTTGILNSALGLQALLSNTTGSSNSALGVGALQNNNTGSNNSAVGQQALQNNTTGSNNCAVGFSAGRFRGTGTSTLTTTDNSVFIGYQSRAAGNSETNQVVIGGTDALGDGSNTTVLGTSATTQARVRGGTFLSTGANGQSTQLGQSTTLLSALSGETVTATNLIPANCILLGVTARVTTAITGATTFDIGDGTTADRFGNDIAIALNTTANNCIAPALVTAATNVVLTANGSNFTGGAVRLTAHFMTLVAPTS